MNQTIPVVEAQYPQKSTILNKNLQHFLNIHNNNDNAREQLALFRAYYN